MIESQTAMAVGIEKKCFSVCLRVRSQLSSPGMLHCECEFGGSHWDRKQLSSVSVFFHYPQRQIQDRFGRDQVG